MAFFSELIGRPVTDVDGHRIGTLVDLVARPLSGVPHPVVTAAIARTKSGNRAIPFAELAVLLSAAIPLRRTLSQATVYEFEESDIRLAEDVLDQQILDTDGARVVRVNDIEVDSLSRDFMTMYLSSKSISPSFFILLSAEIFKQIDEGLGQPLRP